MISYQIDKKALVKLGEPSAIHDIWAKVDALERSGRYAKFLGRETGSNNFSYPPDTVGLHTARLTQHLNSGSFFSYLEKVTAILLLFFSLMSIASAQSDKPWNGFYMGANMGSVQSHACTTSILEGTTSGAATNANITHCPGSSVAGGLQLGENFQTKRLVWGVEADIDIENAHNDNRSLIYAGGVVPIGTYTDSGRLSPRDLAFIGPRIGYAGDLWLPYLRIGSVITIGSHGSNIDFIPAGTIKPIASFSEGKNFSSTGWAAGVGTEIGLNGAWSITVDYLNARLGGSSKFTSTCSGSAAACSAFTDISLNSSHPSFTVNIFRIGINYWFDYWSL